MNCDDVFDALTDPALSQMAALDAHLAHCPRCRQLQQVLEPARSLLCGELPAELPGLDESADKASFSKMPAPVLSVEAVGLAEMIAAQLTANSGKSRPPIDPLPGEHSSSGHSAVRRSCSSGCWPFIASGRQRRFGFACTPGCGSRHHQDLYSSRFAEKRPAAAGCTARDPFLRRLPHERRPAATAVDIHVAVLAAAPRQSIDPFGPCRNASLGLRRQLAAGDRVADFVSHSCRRPANCG